MGRNRPSNAISARNLLLMAALGGWLAVILVAAGRPVETVYWIGLPDLGDLIGVLWLLALAVGTIVILRSKKTTTLPPQATRRGRWFMWVVVAVILLLVATDPDFLDRLRLEPGDTEVIDIPETIEPEPEEPLPPPDLQVEAVHVYVLLAALGGVWLFTRWNRGRIATDDEGVDEEETPTDDLADRLGAMVNRAGAELSRAGQPRRRVMAAYAEIERALADQRLPRRPTETPSEHIRRVLSALPIDPGPLADLGHLYELARFSDHPITAKHQGQALTDLDRTRRELAGLPNAAKAGTGRATDPSAGTGRATDPSAGTDPAAVDGGP